MVIHQIFVRPHAVSKWPKNQNDNAKKKGINTLNCAMLSIDLSEAILTTEGTFYRSLLSAVNFKLTDVVKFINFALLIATIWTKQTFLLPLHSLLLQGIC